MIWRAQRPVASTEALFSMVSTDQKEVQEQLCCRDLCEICGIDNLSKWMPSNGPCRPCQWRDGRSSGDTDGHNPSAVSSIWAGFFPSFSWRVGGWRRNAPPPKLRTAHKRPFLKSILLLLYSPDECPFRIVRLDVNQPFWWAISKR